MSNDASGPEVADPDFDGVAAPKLAVDGEVDRNIEWVACARTGPTPESRAMTYPRGGKRTSLWGDGSGGSTTVSATMQNRDFTIYGTIPARQNVAAGAYVDTMVVTITY